MNPHQHGQFVLGTQRLSWRVNVETQTQVLGRELGLDHLGVEVARLEMNDIDRLRTAWPIFGGIDCTTLGEGVNRNSLAKSCWDPGIRDVEKVGHSCGRRHKPLYLEGGNVDMHRIPGLGLRVGGVAVW